MMLLKNQVTRDSASGLVACAGGQVDACWWVCSDRRTCCSAAFNVPWGAYSMTMWSISSSMNESKNLSPYSGQAS